MDLKLKGRKAVITGGSKGIGRAIADMLADEGCHVMKKTHSNPDSDGVVAIVVGDLMLCEVLQG